MDGPGGRSHAAMSTNRPADRNPGLLNENRRRRDEANDGRRAPSLTPAERAKVVHQAILDENGYIYGVESSAGVRLVSQRRLDDILTNFRSRLGEPDKVTTTPKGQVETWQINDNPPSTLSYRPFSKSGGPTIDINNVDGLSMVKRFHVTKEGL
jgi:hypothetical protein